MQISFAASRRISMQIGLRDCRRGTGALVVGALEGAAL